jgi:DNA polymerase III alpha subunit (gram-positive type)
MQNNEVYVSTDIETDGPIPGPHSMVSFGSAAFTLKDGQIGTFEANLEFLPGASMHPLTKSEFWDKNPAAWAACRKDPMPIAETMKRYVAWVKSLPGKPVFVGYPATFDHAFIHWYLVRFTGEDPFSFSALDMKSYAMAKLGTSFKETTKRNMPKSWFNPEVKHTHIAIDDAIEQGHLFLEMLKWQPSA